MLRRYAKRSFFTNTQLNEITKSFTEIEILPELNFYQRVKFYIMSYFS